MRGGNGEKGEVKEGGGGEREERMGREGEGKE